MGEIRAGARATGLAHRRERGIEAYTRIFGVPGKDMPAAVAGSVEAVHQVAGPGAPRQPR